MSHYTATIIDTTGIQKYIFGSNRLRENIGASHLVKLATTKWVEDCLKKIGHVHIPNKDQNELEPKIHKDSSLVAELVYAGGGNTVILFRDDERDYEKAKEFTRYLTKKILEDAPGLNVVITHQDFNWKTQLLSNIIDDKLINEKLDAKKRKPNPSVPLLGLSITATCNSTGLVAVEDTDGKYKIPKGEGYLASREIVAKLIAAETANEELEKLLSLKGTYKVARDVDDMGRSEGESSYIAIVHADGNKMGQRFEEYAKNSCNQGSSISEKNEKYIVAMRNLSGSVDRAGEKTIEEIGAVLNNAIERKFVNIKENYFPFRPIVYGGDDITFVCDGRLGISLAVEFLKRFEKNTKNLPDEKGKVVTACAGIAIVKTHYPFARAYELCEALCGNAKKFLQKEIEDRKPMFSAIDWHIAASGVLGTISEVREREYQGGKLTARPMRSHEYAAYQIMWEDLAKVIQEFKEGEAWKDKRNKVINLRQVLRKGAKATEQFLIACGDELPKFPRADSILRKQGWLNNKCYYFDAIETMKFHIPLGEDNVLNQD
ncbi:MAG: Cas10/Cmr2 second palm domain-containing protein [Halothece sp.]